MPQLLFSVLDPDSPCAPLRLFYDHALALNELPTQGLAISLTASWFLNRHRFFLSLSFSLQEIAPAPCSTPLLQSLFISYITKLEILFDSSLPLVNFPHLKMLNITEIMRMLFSTGLLKHIIPSDGCAFLCMTEPGAQSNANEALKS